MWRVDLVLEAYFSANNHQFATALHSEDLPLILCLSWKNLLTLLRYNSSCNFSNMNACQVEVVGGMTP